MMAKIEARNVYVLHVARTQVFHPQCTFIQQIRQVHLNDFPDFVIGSEIRRGTRYSDEGTDQKITGGDVGFRHILSEGDWKQFLIRPTVTYRLNPVFALGGALAYFKTYSENTANLNEFRIHQEVNMNWPDFGFARLSFRLRLEERYFTYENLPDDFSFRVRLLGQARTKDLTFLGERRPIYFKLIVIALTQYSMP